MPERRRRSSTEQDNSREAFHATRRLYNTLSWRSRHRRVFLQRTLRRDFPRPPPEKRLPPVLYVSSEPGVDWSKPVEHLRCLWCADSVPRFSGSDELLVHLRHSHGMLAYALLQESKGESPVTISIQLLRGEEGALAASVDRFHSYDLEDVFVNTRRFPRYLPHVAAPPSARRSTRCAEADRRALQAHARRSMERSIRAGASDDVLVGNAVGRVGVSKVRKGEPRRKKRKAAGGTPAFKSVAQAAKDGRLFHSVLQTPLSVGAFEGGHDSDDDCEEEHRWRLQLMDTEIEEFIDTIAVEKLFMNLWNQFIKMEFVARADRHMAPACLCFVKKYRKTLLRLHLEPTFLRHLTELARRGLLDADAVYETLRVLENRDMGEKEGEEPTRFLFAERFEKQEAKRQKQVAEGSERTPVEVQ